MIYAIYSEHKYIYIYICGGYIRAICFAVIHTASITCGRGGRARYAKGGASGQDAQPHIFPQEKLAIRPTKGPIARAI